MDVNTAVISLSVSEMTQLEMIIIDDDKDGALTLLKEIRSKIEKSKNKGMKSHLDT